MMRCERIHVLLYDLSVTLVKLRRFRPVFGESKVFNAKTQRREDARRTQEGNRCLGVHDVGSSTLRPCAFATLR